MWRVYLRDTAVVNLHLVTLTGSTTVVASTFWFTRAAWCLVLLTIMTKEIQNTIIIRRMYLLQSYLMVIRWLFDGEKRH